MNILFYGNCQLYAVLKTLNLPHNYKTFNIGCWESDIVKDDFTNIIMY